MPGTKSRYHLVMVTFPDVRGAKTTRERLRSHPSLESAEVEAEAIVARDDEGEIYLSEHGSSGIGATFGAVSAGVIGLLTGPIILPILIVAGAVLGGLAGHLAGRVLPEEDLERVADRIPPGSSAWLAVVDARHAHNVIEAFRDTGGRTLDIPFETEAASAIREGLTREVTRS
jgi:uncharacterized membrane protein